MKKLPYSTLSSTAFLMSAIAGFADVISFIGVNHLFTAHITGNIVIAISEIIHHDPGVAPKIIAIPLFIAFAIIMTWIIEKHGKTPGLLKIWLLIESFLLGIFMVSGVYLFPHYTVDSWQYLAVGMIAVCAMAIHNTLLKTYMTTLPPCTVMTGNLTQFTVDFVTYFLNRHLDPNHEKLKAARSGLKRYGNVLIGFIVGGLFAAFGFSWIGLWATWMAIVVLLIMVIQVNT